MTTQLTPASLVDYLRKSNSAVTVHALAYSFDLSSQRVAGMLRAMVRDGVLRRDGREYRLAQTCPACRKR